MKRSFIGKESLQSPGFKVLVHGATVFLLLAIMASEVTATERKVEIYLGLNWRYSTFNNAFDGRSRIVTVTGETIFAVPKIHASSGYAVTFGIATSAKKALGFALELTYFWHKHTNLTWYDWGPPAWDWRYEWHDKANMEGAYIDCKVLYWDQPIQPYLLVGIFSPLNFTVKNGCVCAGEILKGCDSDFLYNRREGFWGLRFGAGFNLNLYRNIRLTCTVARQLARCDYVRGCGPRGPGHEGTIVAEIEGGLSGSSTSILVGLQFAVFTRHEGR